MTEGEGAISMSHVRIGQQLADTLPANTSVRAVCGPSAKMWGKMAGYK
jgi:hypothetical protein